MFFPGRVMNDARGTQVSRTLVRGRETVSDSIVKQIAGLHRLTGAQLKERWRELYGTESPGYNRTFLIKRLAYRLQELRHGGLSEKAQARMKGILLEAGLTEDGLTLGGGRARDGEELPQAHRPRRLVDAEGRAGRAFVAYRKAA